MTHIAHSGGTEAGALGAFADFFALSQMDAAIVTRQSTFSMSAMLQGGLTAFSMSAMLQGALAKGNYLGIVGHSQSKQPVTHNEFCTAKLGFEWPKGLWSWTTPIWTTTGRDCCIWKVLSSLSLSDV